MRKKRESISPDLTPVIDIVFILLIFFMVTSVFKKDDVVLALTLPDLHSSTSSTQEESITIELSKDEFVIDGKKYKLLDASKQFSNYNKEIKILIKIDEKVEYSRVMKLFDTLQENKLTAFSLVASKGS
ncbi:MAG: biopolymer transporter ExbD [Campylobacterota bacterium]|nr:biopolymer transporter ExbD [Campylobacterota bacterium]